MSTILSLAPQNVWKHFYSLTQIPRPSGHMEKITAFLLGFGKELGLESFVDEAGNVIIRKPATPGMENRKGVILQAHMDMVPQKNNDTQDIYNEPKNAFVADFIGESNIIDGVMYEDFEVEFAGQAFKCVDKGFAENERVDVVIRPEDIIVGDYETSPISGEVESVIFKGVHYEITVDAHGYKWLIHSTQSQPVGAHIGMNVRPEDIHIMKKMEA